MILQRGEFFGSIAISRQVGPIDAVVSRYPAGVRHELHAHPAPTLYVVLDGLVEDRIGRRRGTRKPGHFVLQRPGEEHSATFGDAGATVANLQFEQAWFDRVSQDIARAGSERAHAVRGALDR